MRSVERVHKKKKKIEKGRGTIYKSEATDVCVQCCQTKGFIASWLMGVFATLAPMHLSGVTSFNDINSKQWSWLFSNDEIWTYVSIIHAWQFSCTDGDWVFYCLPLPPPSLLSPHNTAIFIVFLVIRTRPSSSLLFSAHFLCLLPFLHAIFYNPQFSVHTPLSFASGCHKFRLPHSSSLGSMYTFGTGS